MNEAEAAAAPTAAKQRKGKSSGLLTLLYIHSHAKKELMQVEFDHIFRFLFTHHFVPKSHHYAVVISCIQVVIASISLVQCRVGLQ